MGEGSVAESMQASAIDKIEPSRDGSSSSTASTPEPEPETYNNNNPQEPQQQKRKGGRKPIYATSEERKQRNRQAQAAFRERRTEYIKQLENQIRELTATKNTLKESHDKTADECLMLRYKNSLLEKILQEKGVDVQAELDAKAGSPTVRPTRGAPPLSASPAQMPMQKSVMMNRHPQARWPVGVPQKAEGVHGLPVLQPDGPYANRSPHLQPTATSQTSSPSTAATRSPNFVPQGMIQSPNFGPIAQQQVLRPQPQVRPPFNHMNQQQAAAAVAAAAAAAAATTPQQRPTSIGGNRAIASTMAGGAAAANAMAGNSNYYSNAFQSHMDQLDQEYDAQADMIDDQDGESANGPGPYPHHFTSQPAAPPQMSPAGPLQPFTSPTSPHPSDMNTGAAFFGTQNHLFDPFDPAVDPDPFGLSASMHFPTQFSYETR